MLLPAIRDEENWRSTLDPRLFIDCPVGEGLGATELDCVQKFREIMSAFLMRQRDYAKMLDGFSLKKYMFDKEHDARLQITILARVMAYFFSKLSILTGDPTPTTMDNMLSAYFTPSHRLGPKTAPLLQDDGQPPRRMYKVSRVDEGGSGAELPRKKNRDKIEEL